MRKKQDRFCYSASDISNPMLVKELLKGDIYWVDARGQRQLLQAKDNRIIRP